MMYWLTEPKESFLNEACGDWKNCYKQKPGQKSTQKKKIATWKVKSFYYKLQCRTVTKNSSTEDAKWR